MEDKEEEELEENITIDIQQNPRVFATMLVRSLHMLDRIPAALSTLFAEIKIHLKAIMVECMKKATSTKIMLSNNTNSLGSSTFGSSANNNSNSEKVLVALLSEFFPRCSKILRNHIYVANLFRKYLDVSTLQNSLGCDKLFEKKKSFRKGIQNG